LIIFNSGFSINKSVLRIYALKALKEAYRLKHFSKNEIFLIDTITHIGFKGTVVNQLCQALLMEDPLFEITFSVPLK